MAQRRAKKELPLGRLFRRSLPSANIACTKTCQVLLISHTALPSLVVGVMQKLKKLKLLLSGSGSVLNRWLKKKKCS